ncbi:ADP-ribose glycohydrolase OARD1-like [Glandiceps talaboti]
MSILKYFKVETSEEKRRKASKTGEQANPEVMSSMESVSATKLGGDISREHVNSDSVSKEQLVKDSGNGFQQKEGSSSSGTQTTNTDREKKRSMVFNEMKGDLFGCDEGVSLVHCISQDCRMGKGIATLFRDKFGGVDELRAQDVKPGGVAVLKRDKRYVYYLVTKVKYSDRPTLKDLQSSLEALRRHCEPHDVNHIAMPRIGCGLDGLEWRRVSPIIRDIFKHTNINITVYTK